MNQQVIPVFIPWKKKQEIFSQKKTIIYINPIVAFYVTINKTKIYNNILNDA